MKEYYRIGIPGFDNLIDDISPGSVILLHGPPKVGKSIFCQQFMYSGLQSGLPCLYVAADYGWKQLKETMMNFNWPLQSHIQDGDVYIIDVVSYLSGVKLEDFKTLKFSSLQNLADFMVKVGTGTRLLYQMSSGFGSVIDSLTMLFAFNPPNLVLRVLRAYMDRISEAKGIGIVVHTTGSVGSRLENFLMEMTDIKIKLDGEKIQSRSSVIKRSASYTIREDGIHISP